MISISVSALKLFHPLFQGTHIGFGPYSSQANWMQRPYDPHEERGKFPTLLIAIIAVVIVVMAIFSLVFWYFSSRYGYYGNPYGYSMKGWFGFPMMLIMFPIMIVVLIVVGYVIYRFFRWGSGCFDGRYRYYNTTDRETAMEVLRRRYANGEITKDQYEQMKRDLLA
jgi:putative membrane protein